MSTATRADHSRVGVVTLVSYTKATVNGGAAFTVGLSNNVCH
jgi:hypothetical protein